MHTARLVRIFGRHDARIIGRDRFLMLMAGFIVYITLALRYGLPWLNAYLIETGVMPGAHISQSLSAFYPLIVVYFCVFQGAIISGTIFGFSLLDEKDDNTIKAMMVTPVSLKNYVLYRIGAPTLFSFFTVLFMVWGVGQTVIPIAPMLGIAAGAALTAPMAALFYGIYAENKIQGFAMSKFVGLVGWTILFGWFVEPPWQWLFGLFPPFLISKACWMVLDGNAAWWAALLAGILGQAGMIYWMARRFNEVAYR